MELRKRITWTAEAKLFYETCDSTTDMVEGWWSTGTVRHPKGTVGHGGYDVQLHFISKM